jgi:quinol monooxygenase YgiN
MIIITGGARTRPDSHAEMVALCALHSQRSRAEPGCIAHNVHVDCEDGARLVFLEVWADMAAVKTHFAVPESGGFVKALSTLAAGPPAMTLYSADELPSPLAGR